MKPVALVLASLFIATSAFAEAHKPSQETVDAIMQRLAQMECQMDADDIEMEEEGYDLDDVICKGGQQFDITLDKDLNVTGRRAE